MTHTNVDYSTQANREDRDATALADAYDWWSESQAAHLEQAASEVKTSEDIQILNMAMSFSGVCGLPFHAFCRKYCLAAYRLWMADPKMGKPYETDEQGFCIE